MNNEQFHVIEEAWRLYESFTASDEQTSHMDLRRLFEALMIMDPPHHRRIFDRVMRERGEVTSMGKP